MSKPIKYTIIIPVYNNSRTIEQTVSRFIDMFKPLNSQLEFVLVDDHSKDDSWQIMSAFKQTDNINYQLIRLNKNAGQHVAIFVGFQYVTGDIILTSDADMQVQPEEFFKLINQQKQSNADFVFGTYTKFKPDLLNNIGSRIFNAIIKPLLNMPVNGSNFKVIKHSLIEKIKFHYHPYLFIDTLLFSNGSSNYAEINFQSTKFKYSSYTYTKKIKLVLTVLYHYIIYSVGKREKNNLAISKLIAEKLPG